MNNWSFDNSSIFFFLNIPYATITRIVNAVLILSTKCVQSSVSLARVHEEESFSRLEGRISSKPKGNDQQNPRLAVILDPISPSDDESPGNNPITARHRDPLKEARASFGLLSENKAECVTPMEGRKKKC